MGCRTQPNQGLFDKVLDMGNRSLSGESIFMAHFTNIGTVKKTGQFCRPMSRQNHLQNYQNNILCQKDVFLSVALGTKVFIAFQKKPEPDFLVGKDLFFRN